MLRLAEAKAVTITDADRPVIAADTLVSLHGRPMGQPSTLDEARIMLNPSQERLPRHEC